jgi:hypothetical protein
MIKYIIVLLLSLATTACTVHVGVSAHHTSLDKPEIELDTVLGVVRAERDGFFCEHISAIAQYEQGFGLNHCGYLLKLK